MKTGMKILAAIIVALAIFIPLSLSDSDASSVQTGEDNSIETTNGIDWIELNGEVKENQIYKSGEPVKITGNVTVSKNVSLTFEEGSILDLGIEIDMEKMQIKNADYTISGGQGSCFIFKAGSALSVAGSEIPVTQDTELYLGKVGYSLNVTKFSIDMEKMEISADLSLAASISAGTKIVVDEVPFDFNKDTKMNAKVKVTVKDIPKNPAGLDDFDAMIDINGTVTIGGIVMGEDGEFGSINSSSMTFNIKLSTPKNNGTENYEASIGENLKLSVSVNVPQDEEEKPVKSTVTVESEMKFDVKLAGINELIAAIFSGDFMDRDVYKNLVLDINGSASGSIKLDKIEIPDVGTFKNIKLSSEFGIKDKVVDQNVKFSVGTIAFDHEDDGVRVILNVTDIALTEQTKFVFSEFDYDALVDFIFDEIIPLIPTGESDEGEGEEDLGDIIGEEMSGPEIAIPEGLLDALEDEGITPDDIKALVMQFLVLFKDVKAEAGLSFTIGEFSLKVESEDEGQIADVSGKGISVGPKVGYDMGPYIYYEMKIDSLKAKVNADVSFDAELKGFKAEVKIDTTLSEEKIEGKITAAIDVESLDLKYIQRGNAAYVSLSKFHIGAELSLKDNDLKASASITGSANVKIFESNAIIAEISVKDAKLGVSYDFGEFNIMAPEIPEFDSSKLEIETLSAGIKVTTQGITIEITKINVNFEDKILTADKVTLDGIAAYSEDVASVKATLNSIEMPLGEGSLPAIQSGEITIVMANGAKIVDKFEFKDGVANENITVSGGDLYYKKALPVDMIEVMKYGMDWNLKVSGKGKLIFDEVYTEQMNLQGTVYAREYIETADEAHDISIKDEYGAYAGFVSITDNDAKKMKVVAATGYELVESSYSGFKVGKNGYIEVDEPDSVIKATCIGEEYTVKFDNGKSFKTNYGAPIDQEVDPDVIYVLDSDGEEFGTVSGGFWSVGEYNVPKNINLRLVKAETIEPIPDKEFESDSDDIFFESPAVGQKVIVKTPSKMKFVVEGEHGAFTDGVKITNKAIKYDGKKAFEITANGDMIAKFPVKNDKVTVSHVINGAPMEMAGTYEVDEKGQTYLVVPLESYSTYVLSTSSGSSGSDDGGISGVTIAIIAIVVLLVAGGVAFFVIKNKKTSA